MFFKTHSIREYLNTTATVAGGVSNQEVDVGALLVARGRQSQHTYARRIEIETDVAVNVRFNATHADAISVAAGAANKFVLEPGALAIGKVYISHPGVCGAGSATVSIFAI